MSFLINSLHKKLKLFIALATFGYFLTTTAHIHIEKHKECSKCSFSLKKDTIVSKVTSLNRVYLSFENIICYKIQVTYSNITLYPIRAPPIS